MTPPSEIVKQSDFLNQLVLDRQTLEEMGRVEMLWMYPQVHRVLGVVCKSGFLGNKKSVFKLSQVTAIGSGGVLTQAEPEPTGADKVSQLESLIQHEIWSDDGNRIGKVIDCLFHLQTGEITRYLFASSGWMGVIGEVYELSPAQIISFGNKRILVAESAIDQFPLHREGLPKKLAQAKDSLTQEATQELRSLTQRAENLSEQAKGRLQSLTEQVKEQAQLLSQKAREKAQVINQQLKEETQTLTEQAKQRSQTLAGQMREHSQALGKQVEEGIQTLTVQAEEIIDSITEESSKPSAPASQVQPPQAQESQAQESQTQDPEAQEPQAQTPTASAKANSAKAKEAEEDDDEPWI
jgi:uncharacterized protein YrrD